MKQMEYTIKVVTDEPRDPDDLVNAIEANVSSCKAEVTNYRVLPKSKTQKKEVAA